MYFYPSAVIGWLLSGYHNVRSNWWKWTKTQLVVTCVAKQIFKTTLNATEKNFTSMWKMWWLRFRLGSIIWPTAGECFNRDVLALSRLGVRSFPWSVSFSKHFQTSDFHFPFAKMVKTFQAYLPHCHRTYSCIHCRAHLANHDELISKVSTISLSKLIDLQVWRDHPSRFVTTTQPYWFYSFYFQSFQGSQGRAYLFNKVWVYSPDMFV